MPKINVSWKEEKREGYIVISHPKLGDYEIPAGRFHDIAQKGTALLREHNYGTFIYEKTVSLEIKMARDPADQYIVSVYVNNEHLIDIWCDRITRYGSFAYCFYMKGEYISGIDSKKVKLSDEVKKAAAFGEILRNSGLID